MPTRKIANIEKNVVFVGMLNRIELWAEEEYVKRYGEIEKDDYESSLKSLKKFGI